MKKVLIVPTNGLNLEGITTVIYNYTKAMNRDGLDLHFLTYGELHPSLRERFSPMGQIEFVSDRKQSTKAYIKDYIRLLRTGSFDVVHIHGNSGTMAIEAVLAKLCGVQKVMVHSHSTKTDHPLAHAVLRYPMALFADELVACAQGSGKWLYRNWKFTVLNNAIDITKFGFDRSARAEVRRELGIDNEFLVGHIGHFSAPKNHFYLVDIFQELYQREPGARLLLVGDGPDFDQVKEKVTSLHLQDAVIFAGRRSDAERLYQAMDVFLMPSRWEGLPLVLLEAQASGLPIAASDRITKDVKCTENFWYLNIEDAPAVWAKKLLELAQEPAERAANQVQLLRDRGFDIAAEAQHLRQMYLHGK